MISKTKKYGSAQQKKTAVFVHKQSLKLNVKRAREEILVHVWGKVKRAFFVRTQFEIIEFIFEFFVSFLWDYVS